LKDEFKFKVNEEVNLLLIKLNKALILKLRLLTFLNIISFTLHSRVLRCGVYKKIAKIVYK